MADITYITETPFAVGNWSKKDQATILRFAAKTTWPHTIPNSRDSIELEAAAARFRRMANLVEHGYEIQLVKKTTETK